MYNVNPKQLITMIKNGQNPQQLMLSILEQRMGSTPLGQNLLTLAKNNDARGIEQVVRNIMASRGQNYDEEFNALVQLLGLK